MDQKYLDYARVVSAMSQQGVLDEAVAQAFCKSVLPVLLTEIAVLQRLADDRVPSAFAIQTESPATHAREAKVPEKKARKTRKSKNAKRRRP